MLKVSELRERKRQLEQNIAHLVQAFEQETGVEIDGLITLNRLDTQNQTAQENNLCKVDVHLHM